MSAIPANIIHRFSEKNTIPLPDSNRIFGDLEIFLLSSATEVRSPTAEVDEAWHEFILHTKQYMEYCENLFGRIIHHVPGEAAENFVGVANCGTCSSGCCTDIS